MTSFSARSATVFACSVLLSVLFLHGFCGAAMSAADGFTKGLEQRDSLSLPSHGSTPGAKSPTAIPYGEQRSWSSKQNPYMAGSVEAFPGGARLISPVQQLEGVVTVQGLSVHSTVQGREGAFSLHVVGLSREGSVTPVSTGGDVLLDGSLVRLVRSDVVEEFSVSEDGIRQDFLLNRAPQGQGRLRLELVADGATVAPAPHGVWLVFANSGRMLAYSRLLVLDAHNRRIPASPILPAQTSWQSVGQRRHKELQVFISY